MLTSDPTIKANNDHNVHFLGAGSRLPLIKDFMNRMRDAATWLGPQADREREFAAIDCVLRFRLEVGSPL